MKQQIGWGILGCGHIAAKFASDLSHVADAELAAVGARSQVNADSFAKEFSAGRSHGSYEALVGDESVDVIYVATPHGLHHQHVMLCLENRKAVLCEKAFAINSREAQEMISMAKLKNIFLMEALWTKFLPNFAVVRNMVATGVLGDIRSVLVNFGFIPRQPVTTRIYEPALGGGTMLDIGIYNVFMVLSFLGRPDSIVASMEPAETGVDKQCAVTLKYKSGAFAQIFSSFTTHLPTEACINGNRGRIRLTHRFYSPAADIEYFPDGIDSRQIIPFPQETGFGYQHEARHVCECLRQGLTESPVMTHADTMELMETLDAIRKAAGIHYPVDGPV
ncbi:MAG TPA: Gfo/Idh/MocA family oxidoreductase [Puia sp.]|nr:Gfo/Idh/MocA family oxidoreductase [Puia sp.]